jgi:hypothetical protein
MTRHREPRTRAPRRSYDPSLLWQSHSPGSYAKPESLAATANDLNALINWVDPAVCLLWRLWRLLRHRDGLRSLWIPANATYSVRDVQAELRRLHIPSHPLAMRNDGMLLLVPSKQERWARYVLGRLLAGESVPAWGNETQRG